MFNSIFQFSFFYLFSLYFFSTFFYFDPEFFLSFSAFLIFFSVFAIFNSYSDSLISDRYTNYKIMLSNFNTLLEALDSYTTSLVIYTEDLFDLFFTITNYESNIDEASFFYESNENQTMLLNTFYKKTLFSLFQIQYDEKILSLIALLNETASCFLNEFDFENFKYPKHQNVEIHIWFYEPRSLKQLYVARPIKPDDYIMPDWAYMDL